MHNLHSKTVTDFMVENIAASEIFKKYGINYSSNSYCNISLENICHRHHLEYEKIISELKSLEGKVPYLKNYNVWDLDLLIKFLIEIEHPYKRDNIIFIENLALKILSIHGKQLTEIQELITLIQQISSQIQHHILMEEKTVFPYILFLNTHKNSSKNIVVKKLILTEILENLQNQHTNFCCLMKQIKKHTQQHQFYVNIDKNFKLLLYKLKQFEENLHNHIHIENNILFPKALELEENFFRK